MSFEKTLYNWKWWLLLPILLVLLLVMTIARAAVFMLKFIDGSKPTHPCLRSIANWIDKD